ncbi:MAG: hypothetical protein MHPSP_002648, partial [Paramarteilia canceri]
MAVILSIATVKIQLSISEILTVLSMMTCFSSNDYYLKIYTVSLMPIIERAIDTLESRNNSDGVLLMIILIIFSTSVLKSNITTYSNNLCGNYLQKLILLFQSSENNYTLENSITTKFKYSSCGIFYELFALNYDSDNELNFIAMIMSIMKIRDSCQLFYNIVGNHFLCKVIFSLIIFGHYFDSKNFSIPGFVDYIKNEIEQNLEKSAPKIRITTLLQTFRDKKLKNGKRNFLKIFLQNLMLIISRNEFECLPKIFNFILFNDSIFSQSIIDIIATLIQLAVPCDVFASDRFLFIFKSLSVKFPDQCNLLLMNQLNLSSSYTTQNLNSTDMDTTQLKVIHNLTTSIHSFNSEANFSESGKLTGKSLDFEFDLEEKVFNKSSEEELCSAFYERPLTMLFTNLKEISAVYGANLSTYISDIQESNLDLMRELKMIDDLDSSQSLNELKMNSDIDWDIEEEINLTSDDKETSQSFRGQFKDWYRNKGSSSFTKSRKSSAEHDKINTKYGNSCPSFSEMNKKKRHTYSLSPSSEQLNIIESNSKANPKFKTKSDTESDNESMTEVGSCKSFAGIKYNISYVTNSATLNSKEIVEMLKTFQSIDLNTFFMNLVGVLKISFGKIQCICEKLVSDMSLDKKLKEQ